MLPPSKALCCHLAGREYADLPPGKKEAPPAAAPMSQPCLLKYNFRVAHQNEAAGAAIAAALADE